MPYPSISAAKKAGFHTKLDDAPLTLAQINDLAKIYDAIKDDAKVDNPMAVAITTFKKKYVKRGSKWQLYKANQEASFTRVRNVEELPAEAQVIWNDVYQIVVKRLKSEGVAHDAAVTRAKKAASLHVNRYWEYDEVTRKWLKRVA